MEKKIKEKDLEEGKGAKEEEGEKIECVTTSLKVNPKLWKKAKMVALEREIKLYELVENALRGEIKNGGKED